MAEDYPVLRGGCQCGAVRYALYAARAVSGHFPN